MKASHLGWVLAVVGSAALSPTVARSIKQQPDAQLAGLGGTVQELLGQRGKTAGHRTVAEHPVRNLRLLVVPRRMDDSLVSQIAVLSDARITTKTTSRGDDSWLLRRPPESVAIESGWQDAAAIGAIRELLVASEASERNDGTVTSFPELVQKYVGLSAVRLGLKYVAKLDQAQRTALVRGGEVTLPASMVSEGERRKMLEGIAEINRTAGPAGRKDFDDVNSFVEERLARMAQAGVTIRLGGLVDSGDDRYLIFRPGPPASALQFVLGKLTDDELGLPLTRTNPYRLLEGVQPPWNEPEFLKAVLARDLTVPPDGSWRTALRDFSTLSGIPVISDDYLCRRRSIDLASAGKVLVPRGTLLSNALDRLCRKYGYLWWPAERCCYFRAKNWPRDESREVPPDVLGALTASLVRTGQLRADSFLALASLTRAQLEALAALGTPTEKPAADLLSQDFQDFLQFCGRLNAVQRAQLLSKGLWTRSNVEPGLDLIRRTYGGSPRPILMRVSQKVSLSATPPAFRRVMLVLSIEPAGRAKLNSSFELRVPVLPTESV
jgi:hypothetical protein